MKIILDASEMDKNNIPEPPKKIRYIKKSDGKILEETLDNIIDEHHILMKEQSTLDWYKVDPESIGKPTWPSVEFRNVLHDIITKGPPKKAEIEIDKPDIDIKPPAVKAAPFGFGSVSGLETTLKDIEQKLAIPIEPPVDTPEPKTLDQFMSEPIPGVDDIEPISTEPISDSDKDELIQYTGNENVIVRIWSEEDGKDPLRRSYAHQKTANYLDSIGDVGGGGWHIGDISKKEGGRLAGHRSHKAGRDIDIAYATAAGGMSITQKSEEGRSFEFQKVDPKNLDLDRQLAIMRHTAPEATYIFTDNKLITPLKKRAKELIKLEDGGMTQEEYDRLFGSGRHRAIVRHWPKHDDHFHVRLKLSEKAKQAAVKKHNNKIEASKQETIGDLAIADTQEYFNLPTGKPVKKFETKVEDDFEDTKLQKKIDEFKPERNIVETSEVKDAPEGYLHAYAFGRIGDANPLEEYNSDMGMYPASMSKTQLALANLILSKQDPKKYKRLTDTELDLLLNYTKRSTPSNDVNKRLVSQISNDDTSKWLRNFNIQNALIRRGTPQRGSNKQSAAGYYSFMNQLINYENHPYLSQHKTEAKAILDRINANSSNKRKYDRKVPGSYEGAGFENIRGLVNEELGYDAVKALSGKGGRAFGARNFSFIVDIPNSEERYMFTMYTQDPDTRGKGASWSRYTKSDKIIAQKLAEMIRKHNIGNR